MSFRGFVGIMLAAAALGAAPPGVGDTAPNFALPTVDGKTVEFAAVRMQGPVVLVVLRGFPGYQCPACSRQVREFVGAADAIRNEGAQVLMVYPGPGEKLEERARESEAGKGLPKSFTLALDPDYQFTNLYGLRWDAPKETAYPATFVVTKAGKVIFAKVSKSHGGRAEIKEVLRILPRARE